MANPTTNYGFVMPTPTDLVTDLPADFGVFGQAVDTQMKTNADAATQKATLTTKGDIYAATGTSTPARLAVGANDTVLTADSTAATGLKWATVSSGGMTLLSTTTLSGASVSITGISQSYKDLAILIQAATTSATAWARYLPNGSNGQGVANVWDGSAANTVNNTGILTGDNTFQFQSGSGSSTAWAITQKDYTGTVGFKPYHFYGAWVNGGYREVQCGGYATTSSAITSIDITTNSSFTGGTVRIYGVS